MHFQFFSAVLVMSMETLPNELLVRVLMQMEPEELSYCNQLSKLFYGPPSLVEQALRLLATEGSLSGIPETLPNNHANWTQALLFLVMLQRGSKYTLVAAGVDHSAFVDAGGTLLMFGKLPGLGGMINRSIPTPDAGLVGVRVQSVVGRYNHIIALSVDGMAFSWGKGEYGQLGHGDQEDVARPKAIRALSNVCAIEAGGNHSLAVTSDGALWSWGRGMTRQLGHDNGCANELLPRRLEALASKRMCAVAAGPTHSLAVCVDGGCFAWGHAATSGGCHVITKPQSIRALCGERVSRLCSVAASVFSSRAVGCTLQGDIWQWGHWGGSFLNEPTPLKGTLLNSHRVVSVSFCSLSAYASHCLALTADGAVFSWVMVDHRNTRTSDLERVRHVLGHDDALDAPHSQFSLPRPIEALAGQRICSVVNTRDCQSIAAGWTVTAGVAPATDGQAQRSQWACWSWGRGNMWEVLGHGEKHADTSQPRRVVVIGVTPSEVTD